MKERIKSIKVSPNPKKKYRATLTNGRTIDFGARGYAQYKDQIGKYASKDHGDRARRSRYFKRHSGVSSKAVALAKEKRKSNGKYNAKILSHEKLW